MAKSMAAGLIVALSLAGTAGAQVGGTGAPDTTLSAEDTSRSAGNERNQQFALDRIRDEVASSKHPKSRAPEKMSSRIVAAEAADLVQGKTVYDVKGVPLGTIEAITPGGVQLLSGASRAMVPAEVFAKKRDQLLLNVTKAEFDKQTGAQP